LGSDCGVSSSNLPVIQRKTTNYISLYFFFIKSYTNSILFDIRDIEGDSLNGVKTLPIVLGRNKTKILLLILNSILVFWFIFSYFQGFFHRYLVVLIFAIAYGYWYILHFCREGIKIGKSLDLLVDGEFILIAILESIILTLLH
jgi:4-hydroxybenzoate polyprenyltransferase